MRESLRCLGIFRFNIWNRVLSVEFVQGRLLPLTIFERFRTPFVELNTQYLILNTRFHPIHGWNGDEEQEF